MVGAANSPNFVNSTGAAHGSGMRRLGGHELLPDLRSGGGGSARQRSRQVNEEPGGPHQSAQRFHQPATASTPPLSASTRRASAPVDTYTGKLDYRINSNHQAYLRWSEGTNNLFGDYINSGLPAIRRTPRPIRAARANLTAAAFAVGLNSVVGASKVNEFNFGYTRNSLLFLDPTHPSSRSFRISSPIHTFSGAARGAFRSTGRRSITFPSSTATTPSRPA